MSKVVTISFPTRSAEELALDLGLSKGAKDRIFAIVERTLGKRRSPQDSLNAEAKPKKEAMGKKRPRNSRLRQRNNAKGVKAAAR